MHGWSTQRFATDRSNSGRESPRRCSADVVCAILRPSSCSATRMAHTTSPPQGTSAPSGHACSLPCRRTQLHAIPTPMPPSTRTPSTLTDRHPEPRATRYQTRIEPHHPWPHLLLPHYTRIDAHLRAHQRCPLGMIMPRRATASRISPPSSPRSMWGSGRQQRSSSARDAQCRPSTELSDGSRAAALYAATAKPTPREPPPDRARPARSHLTRVQLYRVHHAPSRSSDI
jgi:hypothetical protein